jgi:ABC-type Fe3+/spermidine/putrescine transport system ATPase subunit
MSDAPLLEADFLAHRRTFDVHLRLDLAPASRFSLFGPSGAGKTTCLEAIAGWVQLAQGCVRLDGRVVNAAGHRFGKKSEPRERGVALVRQPTTLFSHLSVRANVSYGLRGGGQAADGLLELVGLEGLGRALPDTLSGGQRQRASLARAIARPFRALLLDEPFSAVDASSRALLRGVAADASEKAAAVAVLVTHDLAEAQAFGHQLGIIDAGSLLQVGTPDEVVRRPVSVRVADLCGYRSYVPAQGGGLWALHPDRFAAGAQPERGVLISGTVRAIEPYGPRYACDLVLVPAEGVAGTGTVVRVHTDSPPRVGEPWEVTAIEPPLVESGEDRAAGGP